MVCYTREKWRLGVNMILAEILAPMLYGISTSLYLPTFHRFVTNPTTVQNGTLVNEVEPGLGESEQFYSIFLSSLFAGEIAGGLLSGLFVKCIPHWYQFLFAISLHIIGYVLYGIATNGWVLMVGLFLAGYFIGAQLTLSLNYATEMSVEYVNLLRDQGQQDLDYEKKIIRTRNFLYAVNSIGFSVGYTAGPVLAVLFSHLPIEQYRPVAWFNLAFGGMLLLLFSVLFRGESKWKRVDCHQLDTCLNGVFLDSLIVYIIITMHLLSFVQMLRWGFFEELMNPVLSDSFGLTIKASSYVYVGIAFSNVLGSLLIFLLQRLKFSTQAIAFIGIVMTITGYLLTTDWQTIPYDPCTEYSPYHHPERFINCSNAAASNGCMNANVTSEQCHWIPFSMAGKCADCPPICRGEQRTLSFPLYVTGMPLVVGTYQVVWVNLVAIANNQSPESIQGIVIGSINVANGIAETVGPIIVEEVYEGYQKRIFPNSLLFACLNFPFLIEIIVLYKYLGPRHKFGYSRIDRDNRINVDNIIS